MKKYLFLAALASVALASCVNDESNVAMEAPQPLRFDAPVMTTQTRANVKGEILGVQYDQNEWFTVFCRIYPVTNDGYQGWDVSDAKDYFDANGAIAKHDGSYWSTDTKYYWPANDHALAFSAYSPSSVTGVTCDATGLTITDFAPASESDDQFDLMYSDRVYGCTKNNNAGKEVPIQFKHALSSIVFSTASAAEGVTYKITGIKVSGKIHASGTFKQNLSKADDTTDGYYKEEAKWGTNDDDIREVTYTPTIATEGVSVTKTPTIFTGKDLALLLIPQTVPTDAKVEITYTATTNSVTINHTKSILLNEFIINERTTPITEWEMGHRYVYRISFGETSHIYFNPSMTQWKTEPTAIYTITE